MGAVCQGNRCCRFRVWAPLHDKVELVLTGPEKRIVKMSHRARGYHEVVAENVMAGTRYLFRLDDRRELPDPASRFQPEGVHGASEVVSLDFAWTDQHWFGLPLRDCVLYELHVGTFTPEGTFDAIIPHLRELKEIGVTAVELMPVAQFPGERNWGYDGVFPFAVQNSYGGPDGLKRLVNAAHAAGLAVVLDVVYNHLGPEGNYLGEFAPYFTDRYRTPWGRALNFDGPHSDEVRRYFIENALYWQTHFHLDALRLDDPALRHGRQLPGTDRSARYASVRGNQYHGRPDPVPGHGRKRHEVQVQLERAHHLESARGEHVLPRRPGPAQDVGHGANLDRGVTRPDP
jgi:maltooligosyltrehalose trehalohydrolase